MQDKESATNVQQLPPEMREALGEAAREANRQPAEILHDAARQYLKGRPWQLLVRYGKERARSLGYKPSDVNRLIAESRGERGR